MSLVYLIPSGIYDLVISRFLTNLSYERLNKKFLETNPKRILDIGVGTGVPLKHIWNQLPPSCSVLGVDIDGAYVKKAQSIFNNYDLKGRQVEIREQNFYELSPLKEGLFNSIVFSSSFMLMPDREGAIKLAKTLLHNSGYIYFILTLQPDSRKNSFFMNMVEFIKPKIKYFTSIDFGQITYEKEFENLLKGQGLKITHKERLSKSLNIPTKLFRVFVYETQI